MSRKRLPCTVDGVNYKSEGSAAKALGIYVTVLRGRLQSSNFPGYVSQHHTKKHRRKKFIPCSVAGVEYSSTGVASRDLGISAALLKSRLASLDYPDYICAEIPKKPRKYGYTVNGQKYRTLQEIADVEGLTRERIRQKMNDPSYSGYRRI